MIGAGRMRLEGGTQMVTPGLVLWRREHRLAARELAFADEFSRFRLLFDMPIPPRYTPCHWLLRWQSMEKMRSA